MADDENVTSKTFADFKSVLTLLTNIRLNITIHASTAAEQL